MGRSAKTSAVPMPGRDGGRGAGWDCEDAPAPQRHPAAPARSPVGGRQSRLPSRISPGFPRLEPHVLRWKHGSPGAGGGTGGECGACSPGGLDPDVQSYTEPKTERFCLPQPLRLQGNLAEARHQPDISLASTGAAENTLKGQAMAFPREPGPLALQGPGAFPRRKEEEIEALVEMMSTFKSRRRYKQRGLLVVVIAVPGDKP